MASRITSGKAITILALGHDTWPPNSALKKWGELIVEAGAKIGRACNSAEPSKEQMIAAGFQDFVEIQYKRPLNKWPKDTKYKEWGKLRASETCVEAV